MKGIKLVLLSFISAAMLTSCGMNNTNDNTAPSPESTVNTNHDNDVSNDVDNAGNAAGDAVKDVGDAAGDVVEGVGDAAADVAEGVSDAVGGNDANNNGK